LGSTTNTNLGTIIEDAIAGSAAVSVISANQALTALNGAADQARCASIVLTTTTTANFAVYVPPTASKLYVVYNNTSYIATVYCSTVIGNTTAAGTGISIPAGKKVLLRSDGTNITEQMNHVTDGFTIGGSLIVDDTITTYRNFNVYGDSELDGPVTTLSPLTTTSSAYLNGTTAKTVTISVASPGVVTCSTASFVDDTAVVLSTTDTLPTGLSEGTTYYVVGTNIASVFSGIGSISGTTLTITSVYTGAIGVGTAIAGANISAGTSVTALISGTGSTGTYTINNSQTVASDTIRGSYSGAQTFKLATSPGGTAINTTVAGSGTHTATPVSLTNTPPADCTGNQIATAAYVTNAIVDTGVLQSVRAATTQNITLSGTQTVDGVALIADDRVLVKNQLTSTQTPTFYAADSATATFSTASPTLVSVGAGNAPVSGTPVKFTTTGALPVGVSPATTYYVNNVSSSTFQISTSPTLSPLVNVTAAGSGTHTMVVNQSVIKVASAPASNSQIMFTNTGGSLLTGLSETQVYFVVNRTATTFSVSLLASGPAITLSGTASGTNLVGLNSSANNGVYVVNASTWTRAKDANTSAKLAGAQVVVTEGSVNGGRQYATTFEATNSLGSTAMAWDRILVTPETVVTTSEIANADITAEKLDGAQFGSAPIYGVRAWATFSVSGSTVTIDGDGNIGTITRTNTGRYTVTFSDDMPDARYAVTGSCLGATTATSDQGQTFGVYGKTAGGFNINITDPTANNYGDPAECSFLVLR